MIHCYTGDGKGKTTAAAGLAIRAAGNGLKVLFLQFLKNGDSGEIAVLKTIPGIVCMPCEKHFGFFRSMTASEREEARRTYREYFTKGTARAEKEAFDVLILDEFMAAWELELIDREEALRFLQAGTKVPELVLTGRNAPAEILSLCDYVTEMKKVKHPFDRGIRARKGIEF